MKKFVFMLLLLPYISNAKNICPVNSDIPDDMRLEESHYSKKNAEISVNFLNGIIKENKSTGEWIDVPNALKTIDGYIRRKQCLESGNLSPTSYKCSEFCLFMKSSFRYD